MKHPASRIAIAALPDASMEALALRAFLETTGRSVDLRFIATPSQFFGVLAAQVEPPELLILCAHGDDGKLYFGGLALEHGGNLLSDGFLPASALNGRVSLPGCIILCTACGSGAATLAEPFLSGGAAAYVGPEIEQEGGDMLLATHHMLHALLQQQLDVGNAVATAERALGGIIRLAVRTAMPQPGSGS